MGFELACFRLEPRVMPGLAPVTERHARRRTVRLAVADEVCPNRVCVCVCVSVFCDHPPPAL